MINITHFVVSYLFLAVLFSMNTAEETIYTSLFKGFSGYRVRNPFTSFTFSSGHFSECCVRCLQYQNCYSVNIRRDDRFCEINTLGSIGYGDLVDKNGTWTLFIRTNGKFFFKIIAGDRYQYNIDWFFQKERRISDLSIHNIFKGF